VREELSERGKLNLYPRTAGLTVLAAGVHLVPGPMLRCGRQSVWHDAFGNASKTPCNKRSSA
jgi:hypothetical protein